MKTIEELKTYWSARYPEFDIHLWENDIDGGFLGKITHENTSINLVAHSIDELIQKTETFFRRTYQYQ